MLIPGHAAVFSACVLLSATVLASLDAPLTPTFRNRASHIAQGKRIGINITLDYGTFTGIGNDTTGVANFRGVKYADAPVGALRFRAPSSPPKTQLGVVNATEFAPACIQGEQSTVEEGYSEDCLYGNIYVPKGTKTTSKLPVVIYFHGGGFMGGSTKSFPPELLLNAADEPFILTVFAYRLGALGFLGGEQIAEDGDGNAALLDQRASMRWVQKYIGKFGGNKDHVSIWGQSAGAGSTMFHLVANGGHHEGLFHQAMGDSPSLNYAPNMTSDAVNQLFYQYASFANCTGDTALRCLRTANVSALAYASTKTLEARTTSLFPYAPITDGKFIKEQPSKAFREGRFAKVPTFYGSNTNEGVGWWEDLPSPDTNVSRADSNDSTVYNFLWGQYPTLTWETFQKVLQQYPVESYRGELTTMTAQIYAEMRYICTAKMINGAIHNAGLPSFGYHYDNPDAEGNTRHGDDLDAYFNYPQTYPGSAGLFPAMRRYLTSFITSGVPEIEDDWALAEANGTVWKKISQSSGSPRIFLHPGNVTMEKDDGGLSERCAFWRSVDDEMTR